jgi:hypothetical protein
MANPKYKFFWNELTEEEKPHYSDGSVIKFRGSTPELAEGAKRVAEALEARGYKMTGCGERSMSFSKPEFCKAAYVGTTVNPFSFSEPVWFYADNFAISRKTISVREVYKHNGAAANANLVIEVNSRNATKAPTWRTSKWNNGGGKNKYGVDIPTTYETVDVTGGDLKGEVIRKFKPTVSDKVLKNILDKAEEVINGIHLTDPSQWEANADDFPKGNEKEYRAWQRANRK